MSYLLLASLRLQGPASYMLDYTDVVVVVAAAAAAVVVVVVVPGLYVKKKNTQNLKTI